MIRDFLAKIISSKRTPNGVVLTIFGEDYIPLKSVEHIVDRVKILELALKKRIDTIKIMDIRLKKDKELIEHMNHVLDAQNRQMHEQMDIINSQRQQLKKVEQIDWKMHKLKHEQKKIIRMTGL